MTGSPGPTRITPIAFLASEDGYVPGACNIGPWEIRRRRTFAIAGFVAAAILFAALVVIGAPPIARLLVLLPAWGGAFSWLQARRRFCGAYAMAGISNFADGEAGRQTVADPAAHRADVQATLRMARDAFAIALAITIVAVLIPV
jgi:hypothetical protein